MNKIIKVLVIGLCLLSQGCAKEFLDKKPNKALVVPKTLEHFQALLDNGYNVMNRTTYLTQIADGDFEVSEDGITSLSSVLKRSYLWEKDIFEGESSNEWNNPYQQVFYTNIVLEGLYELDREDGDMAEFDQIHGSAFFMRAHALNQLVQQFAEPYDNKTADKSLGVPIQKSSDVNIETKRGTLAQSYEQIINDLVESVALLPEKTDRKTRPSKAAAYAMLARVYLTMGEYEKAASASTSVLDIQNYLIDYNDLDANAVSPFPNGRIVYNDEMIYYTNRILSSFYNLSSVIVESNLLKSYHEKDLRKSIFYTSVGGFKGSYGGTPTTVFTGLATDEVYLIRAESYARVGKLKEAMLDLNTLMENRWKKSEEDRFIPIQANTELEALTIILEERRKELVTRGLRWSDLRRLNADPRFQVTLKRNYQGEIYQLLPNDKRYVFPIPQDEIEGSGIEQNER